MNSVMLDLFNTKLTLSLKAYISYEQMLFHKFW